MMRQCLCSLQGELKSDKAQISKNLNYTQNFKSIFLPLRNKKVVVPTLLKFLSCCRCLSIALVCVVHVVISVSDDRVDLIFYFYVGQTDQMILLFTVLSDELFFFDHFINSIMKFSKLNSMKLNY